MKGGKINAGGPRITPFIAQYFSPSPSNIYLKLLSLLRHLVWAAVGYIYLSAMPFIGDPKSSERQRSCLVYQFSRHHPGLSATVYNRTVHRPDSRRW